MRVPEIPLTKAKKILTEAELEEINAKRPIMPERRRSLGKNKKDAGSKGCIKIAKPEMTLTGFKHTATTMSRKQKLNMKDIDAPQFQDVMSSSRRSQRSRSKASHVSFDELQNPPSEDKSQSDPREGFQVIDPTELPPMNKDLSEASDGNEVGGPLSPANDAAP